TAPRVYFAMAEDGVFFRGLAWVHPRTRVPVFAIVAQSVWTIVILLTGSYEKILNYVVSMDAMFWALTASCVFVLRRRGPDGSAFPVPAHPFSTALFCVVCIAIVANTIYSFPMNTLIGFVILAAGVPVYFLWRTLSAR